MILRSWESLKRFYIPKVIKIIAEGSQWKYSYVSELISITMTTLQAKDEGSYHKSRHPWLYFLYCLCTISLASAADHMIIKRLLYVFTSIWQCTAQVLPSPPFPLRIEILFPLLPRAVFQRCGLKRHRQRDIYSPEHDRASFWLVLSFGWILFWKPGNLVHIVLLCMRVSSFKMPWSVYTGNLIMATFKTKMWTTIQKNQIWAKIGIEH